MGKDHHKPTSKPEKVQKQVSSSSNLDKVTEKYSNITIQHDHSDEDSDQSPDFDYLLKFAPSTASHMILKSDQQLFDSSSVELSKHFSIDSNLLNVCMLSIPFNERFHDDDIEWKSDELERLQENANFYEKKLNDKISHISSSKPAETSKPILKTFKSEEKKSPIVKEKTAKTEKEQIQNWLDDVLDI